MLDFFNDDYSEILKGVVWQAEMLVDLDRIIALCIISVLVYSPIGLLGLQFSHVLLPIGAPVAPG